MGGPPPFSGGLSVEEEAMIGAVDDGNSFAKKTQLRAQQECLLFYVGISGVMITTHSLILTVIVYCPDN